MNKLILPLALIGAIVPVALIGCGGGSGTGPAKTQTGPQTPQNPQNPQPVALAPTTFTLGNGQRVTLTGTRTGTALKGNLKVLAATAQPRLATGSQNVAFPFSIAIGDYGYTGTLTPPRGFTINGNFGSLGSFQMSGQLQTATQDGSYSLTSNGTTDTGILPASGGTMPPPPVTPPAGNYAVTGNLTLTDITPGSAVVASPFNSFVTTGAKGTLGNSTAGNQALSLGAPDSNPMNNGTNSSLQRSISVGINSAFATNPPTLVPFSVPQRFPLGQNFSNLVQYSQASVNGTAIGIRLWRAVSGEVVLRAIGTNSASVELVNVRMRGLNINGTVDTTAGEFTLNGPLNATGLTVENN